MREHHCDRKDKEHKCLGTLTVTESGYSLDCSLCGGLDRDLNEVEVYGKKDKAARRLVLVTLRGTGLSWDCLSAETQRGLIDDMNSALTTELEKRGIKWL